MGIDADTKALVDFFRARLDEEDAAAKAAGGESWQLGLRPDEDIRFVVFDSREVRGGAVDEETLRHIGRHDPASVLRDVEADRRLLDAYEDAAGNRGGGEWTDSSAGYADGMEAGLLLAVKIRAERFSTHRDYRPGWVSL